METCMICKKDMPEYKPEYCCNGMGCGCLGLPIDPPVCSDKCHEKLLNIGANRLLPTL
jgi:hypothetical protein